MDKARVEGEAFRAAEAKKIADERATNVNDLQNNYESSKGQCKIGGTKSVVTGQFEALKDPVADKYQCVKACTNAPTCTGFYWYKSTAEGCVLLYVDNIKGDGATTTTCYVNIAKKAAAAKAEADKIKNEAANETTKAEEAAI